MKTFLHDNYWSAHPKEKGEEFISMTLNSPNHDAFLDNIWCTSAEETEEFLSTCKIPWIAYKVLAAAIKPKVGLSYAFQRGADFVCVVMFDFQVIENTKIVHEIFKRPMPITRQQGFLNRLRYLKS